MTNHCKGYVKYRTDTNAEWGMTRLRHCDEVALADDPLCAACAEHRESGNLGSRKAPV
jgi:hypothetical protein